MTIGQRFQMERRCINKGDISVTIEKNGTKTRLIENGTQNVINDKPGGANNTVQPLSTRKLMTVAGDSQRLLIRLKPTLRVLQVFGYFPSVLDTRPAKCPEASRTWSKICLNVWLKVYSFLMILINGLLLCFNIYTALAFVKRLGIMHAMTTSVIITGMKPLVNLVQLLLFSINLKKHKEMLFKMQRLDNLFYDLTGKRSPGVEKVNKAVISTVVTTVAVAFAFRLFDVAYKSEKLFGHPMIAISPFLVPLLTVWSTVPLVYFVVVTKLIREWCQMLRKAIRCDNKLKNHSLHEYFFYFKRLTATLSEFGPVFNVFTAFSLTWSIVTVCLAIFFITQAEVLVAIPEEVEDREKFLLVVYFNVAWSVIQIVFALVCILSIGISGFATNEECSYIFNEILSVDPDQDKCDILAINCFAYQIGAIKGWGITVLSSFPIQRSTLLTMISLMMTYGMVLIKLRADQDFDPNADLNHTHIHGTSDSLL